MSMKLSNFKLLEHPIFYPLSIASSILIAYSLLGAAKLLKPSPGVNQWQSNVIRLQNYSHQQHQKLDVVLVGSSIAGTIPVELLGDNAITLAMNGGCSQTGLEAVLRQAVKPKILLLEINNTIVRKVDKQLVESNYNPILYTFQHHFPSFREEYKPSSQLILRLEELRFKLKKNPPVVDNQKSDRQPPAEKSNLSGQILAQAIQDKSKPVSAGEKSLLAVGADYIKSKISEIERSGTRVILFNMPGDSQLENTLTVKQYQALMKELFPERSFKWMPSPPPRQWSTGDGVHLTKSDAIFYTNFLRDNLKILAKSSPEDLRSSRVERRSN
jgi:hypothetical protein